MTDEVLMKADLREKWRKEDKVNLKKHKLKGNPFGVSLKFFSTLLLNSTGSLFIVNEHEI